MKWAVIDLETLAVPEEIPVGGLLEIVQIGIFAMDEATEVGALDLFPEEGNGLCTAGTARWWMEQLQGGVKPEWLQRRNAKKTSPMPECLRFIEHFFKVHQVAEVWGNSPEMDLTPLENHFKALRMLPPWRYYQKRDVRTLRAHVGAKASHGGHDALSDARHEAALLCEWKRMKNGTAGDVT